MRKFNVGDRVRCINAVGSFPVNALEVGKVYTVRSPGARSSLMAEFSDFYWNERFERVDVVSNDLERTRDMLDRARIEYRSWHIVEYTAPDGSPVDDFDGFCLVHGSEDGGPYTEYVFGADGNIVVDGGRSYYQPVTGPLEVW
jgi:hypothetical protein